MQQTNQSFKEVETNQPGHNNMLIRSNQHLDFEQSDSDSDRTPKINSKKSDKEVQKHLIQSNDFIS